MSVAEREAEVAAALEAWDALPVEQRAPVAFRDLLARTQADYVSAALGVESAIAVVERQRALHPEDFLDEEG